MKTENENNNGDQTWGRTTNEAYVWENDGHQEHHDHVEGEQNHKRSDSALQEDISKVLAADNIMDASNILVEVNKGVVKLTGTVSEQSEKERAEELANAIPGISIIENQIFAGSDEKKPSSEHHYKTLIHSSSTSPKSVF